MREHLVTAMIIVGMLFIVHGKARAADEIRIGGGGAAISSTFFPIAAPFEEDTGIKLLLTPSTPLKGFIELEKGKVDISTGTMTLDFLISSASAFNDRIKAASFKQFVVGEARIVVFTHRSNPVTSLSKEQLKGIFTGKITNWRAVGGEDGSIIVIWATKTPGQNSLFTNAIMDGESVAPHYLPAASYTDIRSKVMSTPGAIGIDTDGFITSTIRVPQIPWLTTPIYVITKGESSPKVKKLLDYLKQATLDLENKH